MMKAIGFKTSNAIEHEDSFKIFEIEKPVAKDRDILVKVQAVSVNPVDYKIRQGSAKNKVLEEPKIIGWDAVGIVESIGEKVSLFEVGDSVYYSGDIKRPGTNSEFHLVDERIVGHAPKKSTVAEAAAMPLTTITAWEAIFERLQIQAHEGEGQSILIIGGAGGVGSIAIQLAKKLTKLKVIATASRKNSEAWVKEMGADTVLNHKNLLASSKDNNIEQVDYILNLANTEMHWDAMAQLIKPQGKICSIVETVNPVNLNALKGKSVTFVWELMFTRPMFKTDDMIEQHHLLNKAAKLFDKGVLKSTINKTFKGFNVENFKEAHAVQESGSAIGKSVITF